MGDKERAAPALREALEAELVSHPDDLSSHVAYADYLTDQGDPRGDFIRVQLALEDESKPPEERKKLKRQQKKLFAAHWLGELAPFVLDQVPSEQHRGYDLKVTCTFARGWLDALGAKQLTVNFTRALARAPETRLLRKLVLSGRAYEDEYEPGPDVPAKTHNPYLYPLLGSPYLGNVRFLQIGADDSSDCFTATSGEGAVELVKRMPRLEQLHLLARDTDADKLFNLEALHHLRVLRVYHNEIYPLAKLARNPSLKRLTHLLCWRHAVLPDDEKPYIRLPDVRALVRSTGLPALTHLELRISDMGDKGIGEIIDSGILKRLKVLDLTSGEVGDAGARALAACPDLRHLERLILDRNCLTKAGRAALTATGVKFSASRQWAPRPVEPDDDSSYRWDGDYE
jgi:uncharacterized protein (TIGR02996 family)